ncbi:MAG: hypothetical protein LBQ74_20040 [Prevotella sp.]|nr:hypothetical protein [Prevotella sp.]
MDNLLDEAIMAYNDYCEDNGIIFQQPCKYSSETGRKYVYLNNTNGLLAKYDIKTKEIIV